MLLGLQVVTTLMIVVVAFLAGGAFSKGNPFVAGFCAALGAFAVMVPAMMLVSRHDARRTAEIMAAEIGDPAYARIADMKGRSCAVDAQVAKAMRDGRITGAQYGPIMDLAAGERLKGAKTAVAGIAASASCATGAGKA